MRRHDRVERRRTSKGPNWIRLMSLVMMLAVLVMLISRASDSDTWRWLVSDSGASQPGAPVAEAQPSPPAPLPQAGEGSSQPPPAPAGPTDEDWEEAEFMKEALQAVTDLTLENAKDEMPAYEHMVRWALNQPFERMSQRARGDVLFTQLVNAPGDYRGKLIALNLRVKRVLPWDLKIYETDQAPGEDPKPDKVIPVYEAWGTTSESKAWPYLVVLVDVPKGMPLGDELDEKVRFAGYFFKVQKYYDGLHRANRAPVLIGRVDWQPARTPGFEETDWYVTYGLAAAVVLIAGISLTVAFLGKRRRSIVPTVRGTPRSGPAIEQWFDQAESGEVDDGRNPGAEHDIVIGDGKSTGQSRGNDRPFPHGLDADRPAGE